MMHSNRYKQIGGSDCSSNRYRLTNKVSKEANIMAINNSTSRINLAIKSFKTKVLIRQSLAIIQGVQALEHKSLEGEGDGFRVEHRIVIDMLRAVEAQLKDALEVADLGAKS